jgi:hypothetical protein
MYFFFCLLLFFYPAGEKQEVFECRRNKNKNFPKPKPTFDLQNYKIPAFLITLRESIALPVFMIKIMKLLSQQFLSKVIHISKNPLSSNNFDVAQRQRD